MAEQKDKILEGLLQENLVLNQVVHFNKELITKLLTNNEKMKNDFQELEKKSRGIERLNIRLEIENQALKEFQLYLNQVIKQKSQVITQFQDNLNKANQVLMENVSFVEGGKLARFIDTRILLLSSDE